MISNTAKKTIIYILLIIQLLLIPLFSVLIFSYSIEDVYSYSYARVLERQYNYLRDMKDESKIIIVGTSSTSFGFDEIGVQKIEKYFNKKVVLFGNYAAIGNTCILDWMEDYVKEGDIVVYMYEIYDAAMYIGFDGEVAVTASYKNLTMFNNLSLENKFQYISALPKFYKNTLSHDISDVDDELYPWFRIKAFNENGVMIYQRLENIMEERYDPEDVAAIDKSIIKDDFATYVASWAKGLRKKGASVYFRYGLIDDLARAQVNTDEKLDEFEKAWEEATTLKPVNHLKDAYLTWEYFFDGNYHLNSYGDIHLASAFIHDLEQTIYGYSDYPILYPLGR